MKGPNAACKGYFDSEKKLDSEKIGDENVLPVDTTPLWVTPARRPALARLAPSRHAGQHGLCLLARRASPGKKKLLVRL
jgi:hypothetical protein